MLSDKTLTRRDALKKLAAGGAGAAATVFWVDALVRMGARLVLADPHRVVVVGPSQLYGTDLRSPDIRAGMAILAATLCASGQSVISNVEQIDRGFEELDTRLRGLGAKIERAA